MSNYTDCKESALLNCRFQTPHGHVMMIFSIWNKCSQMQYGVWTVNN